MKTKVIYPGTFDPITFGHIDLVKRASNLFDNVIVAVAFNKQKKTLFTLDERVSMAKKIFHQSSNVEVCGFHGLLVDFAKSKKTNIILRGLRVLSDFEYEFQMTGINKMLNPNIETIFLTPSEKHAYVSSSMVREIALVGGDVSQFVPKIVVGALKKKMG